MMIGVLPIITGVVEAHYARSYSLWKKQVVQRKIITIFAKAKWYSYNEEEKKIFCQLTRKVLWGQKI